MNNIINGLSIIATPIGNLDDITYRAVKTLKDCDIIICENPKHSLKLLNKLGIKKKLIALHDYNEEKIINQIKGFLKSKNCVLISDAGSPLISDPGYKLVQYCIKKNIYLTSVPGASSVICALQNSGISINSFCFYGFVPKKKSQANELFHITNKLSGTKVFFSSSHRLITNLQLIQYPSLHFAYLLVNYYFSMIFLMQAVDIFHNNHREYQILYNPLLYFYPTYHIILVLHFLKHYNDTIRLM